MGIQRKIALMPFTLQRKREGRENGKPMKSNGMREVVVAPRWGNSIGGIGGEAEMVFVEYHQFTLRQDEEVEVEENYEKVIRGDFSSRPPELEEELAGVDISEAIRVPKFSAFGPYLNRSAGYKIFKPHSPQRYRRRILRADATLPSTSPPSTISPSPYLICIFQLNDVII
ncbi:hypothetical protein L1887_30302 [Cichorium endivia]|nr:hypothetical protein L1887_30302 [Cichorium endivia]